VPSTLPGKILGGYVMLTGIALFALWTGVIASAFSEELRRRDFRISWEMVSQVPLFASLDAVQIGEIALLLRPLMLPGRYLVVRAGESSSAMFFIASGEVEVELRPNPVRLGAGHYFGEIGLIHEVNRTATIVTLQETRLLVLERDSFETVMARHPDIRAAVEETAQERLYWLSAGGTSTNGEDQASG
jgi:voltage-gated potassium channel